MTARRCYAIETEEHRLIQFQIGPDASLSDRHIFLNLDELTHNVDHIYPDGVKIDSKGHLYIGQNPRDVHAPLAGTILVVDAAGKLLRTLKLPFTRACRISRSARTRRPCT